MPCPSFVGGWDGTSIRPRRHSFSTAFGHRREFLGRILKRALDDPAVPERLRRPDGWPAAMREEYGADAGLTAARHHREALVAGFRNARRVLDEFSPDLVVMWGDDQYENFKEDIIPPFCVLAYASTDDETVGILSWPECLERTDRQDL